MLTVLIFGPDIIYKSEPWILNNSWSKIKTLVLSILCTTNREYRTKRIRSTEISNRLNSKPSVGWDIWFEWKMTLKFGEALMDNWPK